MIWWCIIIPKWCLQTRDWKPFCIRLAKLYSLLVYARVALSLIQITGWQKQKPVPKSFFIRGFSTRTWILRFGHAPWDFCQRRRAINELSFRHGLLGGRESPRKSTSKKKREQKLAWHVQFHEWQIYPAAKKRKSVSLTTSKPKWAWTLNQLKLLVVGCVGCIAAYIATVLSVAFNMIRVLGEGAHLRLTSCEALRSSFHGSDVNDRAWTQLHHVFAYPLEVMNGMGIKKMRDF